MHKHHLLPQHVQVWNDPINLIECTVEEHAEHHRYLWETFNYYEDYVAWQCLSGQINKEEAHLQIVSRPKTVQHKKRLSEANKKLGTKPPSQRGKKRSKETINKMSASLKGRATWNKGLTKADSRVASNYAYRDKLNTTKNKKNKKD